MQGNRFTLKQMADRLEVKPRTFARDVRDKGIPHIVVGKRMRFDPVTVEAFLANIEVKQNVVKFNPVVKRKGTSKFAEAVGI